MHTALTKSLEKTEPPLRKGFVTAVHPLLQLQRAAGNQAVQRATSGAALPRELRSSLESYFRAPLDRVRVHSDAASQAMADSLGARAFTLGENIHLGSAGAVTTGSSRNELLAHEVVHTLQQGHAGPATKLKVGASGDRYEQQADRLSAAFARGEHTEALAVDRVGSPVVQRSMQPTHYGNFEDFLYDFVTDPAGTNVGVEMYMKFHPNTNALADDIGLTQVAMGTKRGATFTTGIMGLHQATSGAGVGRFVDRVPSYPNPIYPTTQTVNPGGDPARLADYATLGITALPVPVGGGRHYDGWGRHGYRREVNGAFVTQPAELYDAPTYGGVAIPNSSQTFETAALAISGAQNSTYYGSVEWGWTTDAAGAMTKVPFRVVSEGVPSVNFLTAATIWNASRVDLGYETTAAVNLLALQTPPGGSATMAPRVPAVAIPINTQVTVGRLNVPVGGVAYTEITYNGTTGYVESTQVRPVAVGAETVDLPVPMVHTVTNPLGSTMVLSTAVSLLPNSPNTLVVPPFTRVTTTRCMVPTATLPDHYEGTVASGPLTGTHGYFYVPDLTLERVGTR